jgi:hypothetical protein
MACPKEKQQKMHIKQRTASDFFKDIELNSTSIRRNSKEKKKTGCKP